MINWFEIPVADMDRAIKFMSRVMQVSLRRENGQRRSGGIPSMRSTGGRAGKNSEGTHRAGPLSTAY